MQILTALFLAAALATPDSPARAPFPDDYKASPCASGKSDCTSFAKIQIADVAALRGFDIDKNWIEAHWEEMLTALRPFCAKASACYANPANGWTWCNDVVGPAVPSICERYPADSIDRRQCDMTSRVLWAGFDRTTKQRALEIRDCASRQEQGERTLDLWMVPSAVDASYTGRFTIYALDSETHVPVQAHVTVEGQTLRAIDVPDGRPTAGMPIEWKAAWKRVPNSAGHRDITPPGVAVGAPGYKVVTFPMPMTASTLLVEMKPAALKPGRNDVVVAVRDAGTGKPVEMRVMGGDRTLGRSNQAFVFELAPGTKAPEIWITSLFDRYSDVVVAPAGK